MTASKLNKLLPYSFGSSLALIAIGLIVNPLWAQAAGTPCYYCTNYYYTQCLNETLPQCKGLKGYYKTQMAWALVSQNCHIPKGDGTTYPCPSTSSNPKTGVDCENVQCGEMTCPALAGQYRQGSVCIEQCNNCDGNGTSCNMLKNTEALNWSKKNGVLPSPCYGYCGCGNP